MRLRSRLSNSRQIAETPELVALHALMHALELATRALVAAHPNLDGGEAPYWVMSDDRGPRIALRIANSASRLQELIERHIAQHTAGSENRSLGLARESAVLRRVSEADLIARLDVQIPTLLRARQQFCLIASLS